MDKPLLWPGDVAALLNLSSRGPVDVWLEKTGRVPKRAYPKDSVRRHVEDGIASYYAAQVGANLRDGAVLVHGNGWAATRPSRVNLRAFEPVIIRSIGLREQGQWATEAPVSAVVRMQWTLEIMSADVGHVVAHYGGDEIKIARVERDDEMITGLLEAAERFWYNHVLTDKPPPPRSDADRDALLSALHPRNNGRMLPASSEAEKMAQKLRALKEKRAALQKEIESVELSAKELIGDADGVEGCFTWRRNKEGSIAWAKVAAELGASKELIAKHRGEPPRVFLLKS